MFQDREARVLEAKNLCKFYGSLLAVEKVTFILEPGQVLGCLGPNGSGKSTTVKMLIGLLEPTFGEIIYNGQNIHKNLSAYRKVLGYVPEEPNLYPHLTGAEYLNTIATLRDMPLARKRDKINSLSKLFSIWPHRHVPLGSYSKGMRQKILLIAALMDNPDILILDEPLSGLDVASVLIVRSLIQGLSGRGKSIFYCSHILEVVEKVCSHLIVLRNGCVMAHAPTSEVRKYIGKSSLEDVFLQLVEGEDVAKIANEIVDVVISK